MGLDTWFTKESEIGYFCKYNFLVKFFQARGLCVVTQKPVIVSLQDAEELLESCSRVLEDHALAEELLPTMDGFFFGNTEYDEEYFAKVEKVKKYLEDTLIPALRDLKTGENIKFNIWY